MSKIIILGDTHFGVSKSSQIYHKYFEKSLEQVFYYAIKNDVSDFIQTGDLYDYRREVQFMTISESRRYFFDRIEQLGGHLYVISGNHDSLYKNTNRINAVRSLHGRDKFITIIDSVPRKIKFDNIAIDFYPWINDENIKDCLDTAKNTESDFAVGHFEFANFPMYPGNMATHGMDHTLFSRYKQIFSGHYHTRSELYVGTPWELTWGDYNDPRGFTVLDTETGQHEFIRNPVTLHTKLVYNEGCDYDEDSVKDHFVKILVQGKSSQKDFDKWFSKISSVGAHDIKVIEASVSEAVAGAVLSTKVDVISTKSIIDSVIDNMDTQLDKDILKSKMNEIYIEAEQLA